MKIKWRQDVLKSQKKRLSDNNLFYRAANEDGIFAYHSYDDDRKISYWDDFSFIYAGRKVTVCWIHPRMKYIDMVEDEYYRTHGPIKAMGSIFDNTEDWYKKVGKSRKTIAFHRTVPSVSYDKNEIEFCEFWYNQEKSLFDSSIVAEESISIKNYSHAQMIYICMGVEVLCEKDLTPIRDYIVDFLKNRPTFVSHVKYDCDDFKRDHTTQKLENLKSRLEMAREKHARTPQDSDATNVHSTEHMGEN